jgi:hypothetical protein
MDTAGAQVAWATYDDPYFADYIDAGDCPLSTMTASGAETRLTHKANRVTP